ncbi:MAG: 3-oxoacyl-[acyl-carrier-protein] synthase 3 [Candidatus Binatia bacterium]|nr:MAG: 3-oxoacyl-[acyl-carrier-protein] synthase 3 [Candidatus Binatia bacterium]
MHAKVLGWGHCLPPSVERAGVSRPIAEEPIGPSTLAARAAAAVFDRTGLKNEDVDFIVFATMTPDVSFPGAACYLQDQLGCATVPALDIRAQCAGFLFALQIAWKFIQSGQYRCTLVVGGEVHSSAVDYEWQPEVARLFGDGAGLALLGATNANSSIEAVVTHADGRCHRAFWCEYPASRQHPRRITREDFGLGRHLMQIDRTTLARFGRETLPVVAKEALEQAGRRVAQVDRFFISHVFPEVAREAARTLGVPDDVVTVPSETHGHLGAGALPVAVSECLEAGMVEPGATVCLAASGAGLAWAGAVLRL